MNNILNTLDFVKRKKISEDLIKYSKLRFNVDFSVAYPQCRKRQCIFVYPYSGFSGRQPLAPNTPNPVLPVGKSLDIEPPASRPATSLTLVGDNQAPENLGQLGASLVRDVKPTSAKRFSHEESLVKMACLKQEKRCRVMHRTGDKVADCGLSTKKGTKNYNSKKFYQYLEKCRAISEKNEEVYLLTLTGNRSDDILPLSDLWCTFLSELKRVVRHLSRDYSATYFYAIQSHADFTPHVHFVLSLKSYNKKRTGLAKVGAEYTLYDVLQEWLGKNWSLGDVHLVPVAQKSDIDRVTSYVCKELLTNIEDVSQKAVSDVRSITEDNYKALNTLYFIETLGSKQFMASKENVSRETKVQYTDKQSTLDLSAILDGIDKDITTIENAIATGTFTTETDSAFYRLLGAFTPSECSEQWFFLSDTEKRQLTCKDNGSLVASVSNRMRRHAEKTLTGHCNLLPYFDRVVKNKQ